MNLIHRKIGSTNFASYSIHLQLASIQENLILCIQQIPVTVSTLFLLPIGTIMRFNKKLLSRAECLKEGGGGGAYPLS